MTTRSNVDSGFQKLAVHYLQEAKFSNGTFEMASRSLHRNCQLLKSTNRFNLKIETKPNLLFA
jgi:hypothetical protein